MIATATWPLTIYYDASCPLCEREISMLMAWDRQSHLQLVDCSPPGFTDAHTLEAGLTCNDLMRAIHARDNAGAWYSGIAVFALAYQAAGLSGMARAFNHPRWRPYWDKLYPFIARHRMLLSRLGVTSVYGYVISLAASRAAKRAQSCRDGACSSFT